MTAGPDVAASLAAARAKLIGLGVLAEDTTDELDDGLRSALSTVQAHGGMPPSGELDPSTRALLDGWVCGQPLASPAPSNGNGDVMPQFTPETGGARFTGTELTYQIDPPPAGMDTADLVGGINEALAAWSAVTPLHFSQILSGADVRFRLDGMLTAPDGSLEAIPGWAAAYARYGQISFSTFKTFSSGPLPLPAGVNDIVTIAAHELGHVLGLGHSTNPEATMYFSSSSSQRALSADDIEGIQRFYGGPATPVPGWFGDSTSGADLVVANVQVIPAPSRLDMFVGHIDNPDGPDSAYYRVGWDVDALGIPRRGWGPIVPLGPVLGHESQGLALAVGHIGGAVPAASDLVMVWIDNPAGENNARYRVAFDLDSSGMNGTWGPDILIPGPWGHETAGLAAAIADVSGNGQPDLIVAWIDNPEEDNAIAYKVGFDLDASGNAAQWSPRLNVSQSIGHESAGLGISVTDLRGNGRPDLVVFWVDAPDGDNAGWIVVGRDLDPAGVPTTGWDAARQVPGWWGQSTSGAGAALANLRSLLRPDLVVLNLDAPEGGNRGYTRVLSPPLPTWNQLRARATMGQVQRVAAVAPAVNVIVAGARSAPIPPASSAPVTVAVWDQTDNNENQGSDILEFVPQTVIEGSPNSPIALASRGAQFADAFWIGTDGIVRTRWSNALGQPGTPDTGPAWSAGTPLSGSAPARDASPPGVPFVPSSPIAAASIHEQHLGVFFVGREDEILRHSWTQAAGWSPVGRLVGRWVRPVTALAAVARGDWIDIHWVDGSGAIWECEIDDQGTASAPVRIAGRGSVDRRSNLAAVCRNPDQVDLFWIERVATGATSGRVLSSFWTSAAGWSTPFEIGGGRLAALPGCVAAVHAGEQRLQVFWETADRALWSTWWALRTDGTPVPWSSPVVVAPANSAWGGLDMAAVARETGHVRLCFVDAAGNLAETFWGATP